MSESVGVIIIITAMIFIGFGLYIGFSSGQAEKDVQEKEELDLVRVSQIIFSMPEFRCSSAGVEKIGCLELEKIHAFKRLYEKQGFRDYYRDYFGRVSVNLTVVRPIPPENYTLEVYSNPGDYTDFLSVNIPVSVYSAAEAEHLFGVLTIARFT